MGLLDWLFGRKEEPRTQPAAPTYGPGGGGQPGSNADEQALQRYRYMIKTAPPEAIEQAHEEAFAKLTPAQRAQVLQELAAVTPEKERASVPGGGDDPKSLARLATRAEMRQPGVMERIFGGRGMGSGGMGMGGMLAGSLFGSLVAGFAGSMIANEFFNSVGDHNFDQSDLGAQLWGDDQTAGDASDTGDDNSQTGDDYSQTGDDSGSDWSNEDWGSDWGGDDSGGDWSGGDWGGDWGGGDFGGGDW